MTFDVEKLKLSRPSKKDTQKSNKAETERYKKEQEEKRKAEYEKYKAGLKALEENREDFIENNEKRQNAPVRAMTHNVLANGPQTLVMNNLAKKYQEQQKAENKKAAEDKIFSGYSLDRQKSTIENLQKQLDYAKDYDAKKKKGVTSEKGTLKRDETGRVVTESGADSDYIADLEAKIKRYSDLYYTNKNESQLSYLEENPVQNVRYQQVAQTDADNDVIKRVLDSVNTGNFEWDEDYDYIVEKFGITTDDKSMEQYRDELMSLLDEGNKFVEKRAEALKEYDIDYEGLENYKAMLKAQEEYDAQVERAQQNYEERPFLSNLQTVANAPGMAVEAIAKGIKSIGHNDPTDFENYRPMNKYNMPVTTYVQTVRQATDEDIDSEVLSFLYNTGMSVADSTVLALTLGPAATVAMGGASAASYMQEAVDRGLSNKQILAGSIATGAAEAVFEYFSIDKLLNGAMNANTVKEMLKSIGVQAAVEGTEEMFTEVANIISDGIIAGRNSTNAKLVEQYMAEGMTEEEAKKQVMLDNIKNIALAGLGGALSGGVSAGGLGAANVIGDKLSRNRAVTDYAKAIQADTEMMQAYVESGLESEEGTAARKQAEKIQQKLEGDKKVSTKEVKNLIKADEAQVTTEEYGFTPAALKKAEDSYNTYRQTTKSPVSKETYFGEYQIAYEYGKLGVKQEVLNKSGVLKNLSENARIVAYNQGLKETTLALGQKQMKMSREEIDGIIKGGKVKLDNVSDETIKHLNADQMSVVRLADVLTKIAPNMTVKIFESSANKKGEFEEENGSYRRDTRTLSLDLNAGRMTTADYRTTLVRTLSHELTHFIEAEAKDEYKALSDFVIKKLTEGGKYTIEQRIDAKIRAAKEQKQELSREGALAEVIADGCEMVFENSEAFAELAQTNRTLWEKIKDWFNKTLKQLKAIYKGVDANSYEGQVMKKYIDELTEIWDKGFKKAVENSNATEAVGVQIDTETESAAPVQMSMRTWNKSEYVEARDLAATSLSMALGVTKEQAFKYIDDVNSVAKMIADDKVRLDYTPELEFSSVIKSDSEYDYTVDASTLCPKRLLFTGTMNAIQKALPNTILDSEATVKLRSMMMAKGYEVACGICYVESTRREISAVTKDFIDRYKISQKTGKPMTKINAQGQEKLIKSNKETGGKTYVADKNFTPTLADLNTTDGLNNIRKTMPDLALAFDTYMNMRGQQKPKLLETRAEYKGEILKLFKNAQKVANRNAKGGLRLQSYSDFETPHLIDMMQVIMDMSRVRLKSQAYAKVPDFAWVFGDTGVKINLSLIAKGEGVDAKGNLIFDDVEGMPFEEAMKLRDRYSENVGTILVGKNDRHIITAMADNRIDYIIPFHKSQWNANLYEALGLTGYDDYTDFQNERDVETGKAVKANYDPSEYWDFSKSGDENAKIYLEKCAAEGRVPKFPQFQNYPGYWKLLIDFKMYNNEGVGAPQKVVKPDFNMVEAERIMKEYEGGADTLPVAKDIVDEFVKEYKEQKPAIQYQGRKITDLDIDWDSDNNSSLKSQIQKHMGKIKNMTPVYDFRYDRNGDEKYYQTVENTLKSRFNYKISRQDGLEFLFDKNAIATLRHYVESDAEAAAVIAAPYVLKRGKIITGHKNHKGGRYPSITIAAPVKANGSIGYEGVAVLFADKNRVHSLRILSADGKEFVLPKKITDSEMGGVSPNGAITVPTEPVNNSKAQNKIDVKQNQLRRDPYTDRQILEDAVTSIDRSAFTSQELTVLDRFRGRLNEIGNTEHLIKKYKDMGDNITPADKNRLKNAEARLIKQNDELFESLGRTGVKVVTNKATALLIQKYGSIEPGEKPFREVSVPARTNKGNKVSQTVRTAMEAEATSDEMVERLTEEVVKGGFSYIPITDAESKKYADDTIKRKGWNDALLDWTADVNKNQLGKNNVALGFQLYNNALNAGDTETAVRILTDLAARVREGAQMVQAVRMLKKLSPEYQLYGIQRSIQTLQDSLNERYGDKAPQLEMDSQLVKNYEQAETEEARNVAQEAIYRHVAAQIPHTFMDKWNSWRYLAMLFNPRTHVRNILGNAMFAPVRGVKNATAALIEKLIPQEQRTKAIASGSKLYKAAFEDYKIVADQITGAGKYNDAIGEIERMKPAFGSSKIAKPFNWLANANSYALEAEDMWFSRPAYASALAGYLKARGITDMSTMQQSELDKARAYAIKEAQKATYRDFNDFSNFISAIGRKSKAKNKVVAAAQTIAEGVLPFRRTPANILVRGIEYSPVGLAKGIVQATRGVKKGTATAAEAIDSIASGLVGSALLGLGIFLVKQGVLSAGEDKDKKQQEFDELMGGQNYALTIGDINFTIDWLAPEALPLFVGAEIANVLIENDGEFNLAAVLEGVSRISEPMLEMSMLSSLQDVIENVSYSDGKLMGILVNAFISYLSQGLPTLAGQIERVTETERETTWVDRNKTQIERDLQYLLGKSANKTPGEYQQIPYIDAWGRRESTGTVLARVFNNMLNPAYVSEDVSTPTDNELQRLYDLGFDEVFPSGASQSDKIDGEYLSADEYVKYAETRGQRQRQLVEDVTSADWYDKLDDTEKSEVIKKAYDYAAETAKRDVKEAHEVPKWAQEVEKTSDKAESIKNYALNLASEEMSSTAISKYYEKIESTGIEFDTYKDYYVRMKEAKGTDTDGDGKTDSGSKKKAVMDIINSLNISRDQKDALYLLSYKESTIDEAPWH